MKKTDNVDRWILNIPKWVIDASKTVSKTERDMFGMTICESGSYVGYEDYKRLFDELEELHKSNQK